jgi:hypothetical protein
MIEAKTFAHPFYWASFIPSGDWRSLEGKEVPLRVVAGAPGLVRARPGACGCKTAGRAADDEVAWWASAWAGLLALACRRAGSLAEGRLVRARRGAACAGHTVRPSHFWHVPLTLVGHV